MFTTLLKIKLRIKLEMVCGGYKVAYKVYRPSLFSCLGSLIQRAYLLSI